MNSRLKSLSIAVFLLLALAVADVHASDAGAEGVVLSIEDCVNIALGNSPSVAIAEADIRKAQSLLGQARSAYYPRIDWSSSYTRFSETQGPSASNDEYSTGPALSHRIFDFGRTRAKVSARELSLEASMYELRKTESETANNVRQAYYGVLKVSEDLELARLVLEQNEAQLVKAKALYETGSRPRIDVTKAEADTGNSRLSLIRAGNALKLAYAELKSAMGLPIATPFGISELPVPERFALSYEDALSMAYSTRPDLKASKLKTDSARRFAEAAGREHYPIIEGSAKYAWSGSETPLDESWTAGLTLTIPIFSGFMTRHQEAEASSALETIKEQERILVNDIALEVLRYYLTLKDAEERISVSEITVRYAEENLLLANGRYETGVGSSLEVTDALVSLLRAKTSYNEAVFDYRTALANLWKAMGE